MVQTAKIRKTGSDKFPLTLHPTRQFCKKIKGKLYYNNNLTLKWLGHMYLDSQEARAMAEEIKPRQIHDQRMLLRRFVKRGVSPFDVALQIIGNSKIVNRKHCTGTLTEQQKIAVKALPSIE